jgi:hypothetical protein
MPSRIHGAFRRGQNLVHRQLIAPGLKFDPRPGPGWRALDGCMPLYGAAVQTGDMLATPSAEHAAGNSDTIHSSFRLMAHDRWYQHLFPKRRVLKPAANPKQPPAFSCHGT